MSGRWNGDPPLIAALLALAGLHFRYAPAGTHRRAMLGWAVAAFAFVSPLCALSVALFAGRVAQHMILILVAAPLIASALPGRVKAQGLWAATTTFAVALWAWHMPAPYDATLHADATYWAMHLSLFASAVWLWRDLLGHGRELAFQALAAGVVTTVQMSLLGAVLTLAARPFYTVHLLTTGAWGLTPLEDQQLGGIVMWVPACALFVWVAVRSARMLAHRMEPLRS